jgi:hypothetical protein
MIRFARSKALTRAVTCVECHRQKGWRSLSRFLARWTAGCSPCRRTKRQTHNRFTKIDFSARQSIMSKNATAVDLVGIEDRIILHHLPREYQQVLGVLDEESRENRADGYVRQSFHTPTTPFSQKTVLNSAAVIDGLSSRSRISERMSTCSRNVIIWRLPMIRLVRQTVLVSNLESSCVH